MWAGCTVEKVAAIHEVVEEGHVGAKCAVRLLDALTRAAGRQRRQRHGRLSARSMATTLRSVVSAIPLDVAWRIPASAGSSRRAGGASAGSRRHGGASAGSRRAGGGPRFRGAVVRSSRLLLWWAVARMPVGRSFWNLEIGKALLVAKYRTLVIGLACPSQGALLAAGDSTIGSPSPSSRSRSRSRMHPGSGSRGRSHVGIGSRGRRQ